MRPFKRKRHFDCFTLVNSHPLIAEPGDLGCGLKS
jgi:hypothetical protein